MLIQQSDSDSVTGAVYPNAVRNADDVRIGLKELFTEVTLGVYVDQTQFTNGAHPLTTIVIRFTEVENTTARDLLTDTLYQILVTRDEFAGATLVA
jgi:hypothetical protein